MKGYFVYMFLGENDEVLYIGSTINLHSRIVLQHFKSNFGNLSEDCLLETKSIFYHKNESDSEMKIFERYLINVKQPKYNKNMSRGDTFNFALNCNWILFTDEIQKLLVKKTKDFVFSKNTVKNNIVEIVNLENSWVSRGFYLKKSKKTDMTSLIFRDIDEYDLLSKRKIYLIYVNNDWYINDSKILGYHVAYYKKHEPENFISVVYEDQNKKNKLELEKNGESPCAGFSFVKIKHAKSFGVYSDKKFDLILKKIENTIILND